MNGLFSFLRDTRLAALGWTLGVILIETLALGIALAIWRLLRPRASASRQYSAGIIILSSSIALSAATPLLLQAWPGTSARSAGTAASTGAASSAIGVDTRPSPTPVASTFPDRIASSHIADAVARTAGALWIAGVLILAVRLLGGIAMASWIRRRATPVIEDPIAAIAARLCAESGVTVPVQLLQSAHVEAPVVAGWRHVALVLPSGVLRRVAPDVLEPILAHELAHVRRRDYLANLVQSMAELPLFFSPPILWVSRRIREAREYCCDDAAVRGCGDPRSYINALMTLASLSTVNAARPMIGASGPRLVVRVRRILEGDAMPKLTSLRLTSLLVVLVAVLSSGWKVAALTAARTARSSASNAAFRPAAAQQNGPMLVDIPYGYGVREGAGVEINRLRHSSDTPVQQLVLRNVTDEVLIGVRFVAVVQRFPLTQPIEIVTSDFVPTQILPQTDVDLGAVAFPELRKVTMSGGRMQVFFSIQEARFANNVVWKIVPNPAARTPREALGFEEIALTRAFLTSQAALPPNPQAALCYDQNGKSFSSGAIVRILNEPGRTAVCRTNRWEEGAR
jgi:beta-lactamase regulating signal transducer with metallopeptidase domain